MSLQSPTKSPTTKHRFNSHLNGDSDALSSTIPSTPMTKNGIGAIEHLLSYSSTSRYNSVINKYKNLTTTVSADHGLKSTSNGTATATSITNSALDPQCYLSKY
ncbi:unnamed protein product, partial [Didymodactylos carnosus]